MITTVDEGEVRIASGIVISQRDVQSETWIDKIMEVCE